MVILTAMSENVYLGVHVAFLQNKSINKQPKDKRVAKHLIIISTFMSHQNTFF
jgi:hypothetical protein